MANTTASAEMLPTASSKQKQLKSLVSKYGIYFAFIGLVIFMSAMHPAFLTVTNILNIIRQVTSIGLIALGVTIIIITRGIDLSSGSVLALVSVVAASLAQNPDWHAKMYPSLPALPVIVPIVAALAIGSLCGAINGTFVAKTGIPPFIATLGMMIVARGAALIYSDGRPVSDLNDSYNFIGQGEVFGIPFPVILFIVMALISWILLNRTRFGKYAYSIGGNEQAAFVSGINVAKYKILVYTFGGFLAGMAGLVLSARISSGQPGLGNMFELDAIAAATIGGVSHAGGIGTIQGTVVGALIIGVLNNGLDLLNVSAYWQQIIKGSIIVAAVVFDMRKNARKN